MDSTSSGSSLLDFAKEAAHAISSSAVAAVTEVLSAIGLEDSDDESTLDPEVTVATFWKPEALTGLNEHVQYLHTKYMLVDPLGSDPIVVTGSANFSVASTKNNDENMMVIRGNKRVADVYVTEFFRLFDHWLFRQRVVQNKYTKWAQRGDKEISPHLRGDSSWAKPYFEQQSRLCVERNMFTSAAL